MGGCSDALVLHSLGKLEPRLREAAGEALEGGEAALPPPSGVRGNAPGAGAGARKKGDIHAGHGREGSTSSFGELGSRPALNRSLSA